MNTLWTWVSVTANLVMAIFVTRLLVRRLGVEATGLWVIVFGLIDYYAFFDFGVRAAIVKYVAEHSALKQDRELAKTLNTAFLYFLVLGAFLLGLTLLLAAQSPRLVVMSEEYRSTFAEMVLVAGAGWALNAMFGWFAACLEAIQRFDVTYRLMIGINVCKVAVTVTLLEMGFGLLAITIAAVGAQLVQCALLWRPFARHFPQFRWAFWDVDAPTLRKMFRFGIQVVPSTVGSLLLGQGPGIVIGHVIQAESTSFYAVPRRLTQSFVDLVQRLGSVTTSRAAELSAHNDQAGLVQLGIQTNRYSLTAFMAAAVFLAVYGDALLGVWLIPAYATLSAPLLPVFLLGTVLSEASQFSSGAMLYGMGRHKAFAWLLLVEGVVSISGIYFFALRGNLLGAAIASTTVMVLNRGFIAPALLCRELRYPTLSYIAAIIRRPFAVGVAATAAALVLRLAVLPGRSFLELAVAGALICGVYAILAGRYCVFPDHQDHIVAFVRARAPRLEAPVQLWFGTRQRVTAGTSQG